MKEFTLHVYVTHTFFCCSYDFFAESKIALLEAVDWCVREERPRDALGAGARANLYVPLLQQDSIPGAGGNIQECSACLGGIP